ncbi:hypothetical protein Goari_017195 [Gossypium aridum]|uniref:COBRA C-terminal domain-containing protein n=1 Tax=Gossypium aridum TaxID=34290 RepID=A0A7J8WL13_GOSAI|nr:hypothetical protein [Gossypium aridum]
MVFSLISFFILISVSPSNGYDPLDPHGNITIKWDLLQSNPDTNDVRVSIFNFQLYRHIERPGWQLGWEWQGDEAIMSMLGAEATEQGNCSRFKGGENLPHCCEKQPMIIDLLPEASFNMKTSNCCKGGVLSSMVQDPSNYAAIFVMKIGAVNSSDRFKMPGNFSFGVSGYTCGQPVLVPPSRYSSDSGRRWTQALVSRFDSDFNYYNKLSRSDSGNVMYLTNVHSTTQPLSLALNAAAVAMHPNVSSSGKRHRCCKKREIGINNDSGMFWGIRYYNDMLLQEGENGYVQTEMLMRKGEDFPSFRQGWGFPTRVLFNGDECVMPLPDQYPTLPNNGGNGPIFSLSLIVLSLLVLTIVRF